MVECFVSWRQVAFIHRCSSSYTNIIGINGKYNGNYYHGIIWGINGIMEKNGNYYNRIIWAIKGKIENKM